MPVVWDLCSGLGGFSEAFVQAGWHVVRIDNSELVQHVPMTLDLDVKEWRTWVGELGDWPDLIIASPPCLEFSNAYAAPRSKAARAGLDYEPDMSILQACIDIIEYLAPAFWMIENVAGSIKYFTPLVGEYSQKLGPFFLWGNVPRIVLPGFKHSKSDGDTWSDDPLRPNRRAMIPFEVSFALLETLRFQKTLEEWML